MTVVPRTQGTAGVEDVPAPAPEDGGLLVRGMLVGVCGTDHEIAHGVYGSAPALAGADHAWLSSLISRRVPLARWPEALARGPDDIKVVVDLAT